MEGREGRGGGGDTLRPTDAPGGRDGGGCRRLAGVGRGDLGDGGSASGEDIVNAKKERFARVLPRPTSMLDPPPSGP